MKRLAVLFAVGLLVLGATAAWAGDKDGKDIAELRQKAERGDAEAQYEQGAMYRNGLPANKFVIVSLN